MEKKPPNIFPRQRPSWFKFCGGKTAATMAKVAGLSEELRALDAELRSLGGGGDAAIAPAAVYCSVCPAPVRSATVGGASRHTDGRRGDGEPVPAVALLPGGDGVAVRDPSDDTSQEPRRYRMTAASDSGDAPDELARDVCDWLMRGFDALVVTHGQSGTGKSHVTFGGGGMGVHPSPTGGFDKPGVITRLFRLVFTRAAREEAAWRLAEDARMHAGRPESIADEVRHRFGVSCWEMSPDGRVVDLLDPTGDARGLALASSASGLGDRYGDIPSGGGESNRGPSSFESFRACAVEVSTAEEAEAVLAHSRRISANWTLPRTRGTAFDGSRDGPGDGPTVAPGPWAGVAARVRSNRAHAFVRLTVVREPEGVVSECHVCDLVGARALGLAELRDRSSDGSSVEGDRDRRGAARQLLAFSRVVDELSRRAPKDGPDSSEGARESITARAVRGARDSRLTQTLAPLMASGARTFMLCTVSPLPDDHLDTLNTLRVAQRCARIDAACVRRVLAPEHRRALRSRFTTLREAVARADAVADAALVSAANAGVVSTTEALARAAERAEWGDGDDVSDPPGAGDVSDPPGAREPLLSPIKAARIPAGLMPGRTPPRTQPSNLMREFMEDVPESFRPAADESFRPAADESVTTSSIDRDGDGDGDGPSRCGDSSSAELGARLAALKDEFVAMYAAVDPGRREGAAADAQRDERRLRRTPPTSPGKYVGNRRVRWPDDSDAKDAHDRYFDEKENAPIATEAAGDGGKPRPPPPSRGPIPTNPEALRLEVEEQRRRYDALLGMLHAEESARLKAEEKAAAVAHDAAERVAAAEAAAADAARSSVEAKARVRAMEDGTDYAEIFARYEMDIDNLDRECARLREEAFLAHVAVQGDVDTGGDEASRVLNASADVQRRVGALKRALRKSEERVDELERTLSELRRRERLMDLHSRQHDDQIRRLQAHERQIVALRAELQRSQLSAARSEARREESQRDAALARARESGLREDNAQLAAEVERRGRKMRAYENRVDELEQGRRVGRPGGTKTTINSAASDFATRGDYDAIQSELELRDVASQLRRAVPPGASARADRLFDALYGELDTLLRGTRGDEGNLGGAEGYAGTDGGRREPWRDYLDPRASSYGGDGRDRSSSGSRPEAVRKPSSPSPERLNRAMAAHVERMARSRSPATSPRREEGRPTGGEPRGRSRTPPRVVPKRLTLARKGADRRSGRHDDDDDPLALAAEEAAGRGYGHGHGHGHGGSGGAHSSRRRVAHRSPSPSPSPPVSPRAGSLPDYSSVPGGYVPGQHSAARAAARATAGASSQSPPATARAKTRTLRGETSPGGFLAADAVRALEAAAARSRSPEEGGTPGATSPTRGGWSSSLAPPPTDDRGARVLESYASMLQSPGTYETGAPPSSLARSPPGSPRPFYPSGPTPHPDGGFR